MRGLINQEESFSIPTGREEEEQPLPQLIMPDCSMVAQIMSAALQFSNLFKMIFCKFNFSNWFLSAQISLPKTNCIICATFGQPIY
jgi:hypothetical protein